MFSMSLPSLNVLITKNKLESSEGEKGERKKKKIKPAPTFPPAYKTAEKFLYVVMHMLL